MEKKLPLLCSLAALILSAAALVAVLLAPRAGEDALSAADTYRLEKLNAVSDLVLERQVVPSDYLRYLDEELAAAVEEYNLSTSILKQRYLSYMENVTDSLAYSYSDITDDNPSPSSHRYLTDAERPDRYYVFLDRVATLALFQNPSFLLQTDSATAYLAMVESGGSGGLWSTNLLQTVLGEEETHQLTEEYFAQVDALLDQLDAARAAF